MDKIFAFLDPVCGAWLRQMSLDPSMSARQFSSFKLSTAAHERAVLSACDLIYELNCISSVAAGSQIWFMPMTGSSLDCRLTDFITVLWHTGKSNKNAAPVRNADLLYCLGIARQPKSRHRSAGIFWRPSRTHIHAVSAMSWTTGG